jgi:FkbM family methyltransferase
MLYNINQGMLSRCLETYGEVCELEAKLFAQILKPGMVAVDAGASFGVLTLPMARAVGPQGGVLAFEPQLPSFQILCANMALNGIYHVQAHRAALGREAGKVRVPRFDQLREGQFGTLALGASEKGETVARTTLDSFTFGTRCDLIKIDVEGMELDVLAGGQKTIEKLRPIIYVENDRADNSPALIQALWDLGYDCHWHVAYYVTVPNLRGVTKNLYPSVAAINMTLGLPARNSLQSPCAQSAHDRRVPVANLQLTLHLWCE